MKDGRCPKCGSDKVYSATDLPLKGGPFASNSIPISLTSMASLDNYVCVDCGLVESYVADQDKLEEIARKWTAVNEDLKPEE
jgi:predicted nucleic-acid-binding Zn-ribbon protein